MSQNVYRRKLAELVFRNAQVGRAEIFGASDDRLHPISEVRDTEVMFAGYVGERYRPKGCVLVAINPGGGGDGYRRTPEDSRFYPLLYALKEASKTERLAAFKAVNRAFVTIVRGWNVWLVIYEGLLATGFSIEEVAYLNAVPYRTRQNKTPPVAAQAAAWEKVTRPLLSALDPKLILALGKPAGEILSRFYKGDGDVFKIRRTNGDRYLHDDARATLDQIRRRQRITRRWSRPSRCYD